MKIIADQNMPLVEELFAEFGDIELLPGREICAADLLGADLLLVRSVTQVNQQLLADSNVKFVGSATIGTDHVDRDYLHAAGIEFAHAPGCNAEAVVQYDLSAICRLMPDWQAKTIGIVGCGNVGSRLYKRLLALGVNCVVYDPFLDVDSVPDLVDFDTLIGSDIICLHTPLTSDGEYPTYHLFDAEVLARLKPDCLLINAGRGAVIDNKALYAAFKEGLSAQVVLDVWEPEPLVDVNLMPFVAIGTPHIAGYSLEGKIKGTHMVFEAFKQWAGMTSGTDYTAAPEEGRHLLAADDLNQGIVACYDVSQDSRRMADAMQNLEPGSSAIAKAFDQLRRDYPVRREFSHYQLSANTNHSAGFKCLGFVVDRAD